MALTPWVNPTTYAMQWVWVAIGVVIPADGLVAGMANSLPLKLGNLRIIFDWTLVSTAVVLALVLLGRLEGVREGTILTAFGVGMVIKLLGNLEAWFRATRNR